MTKSLDFEGKINKMAALENSLDEVLVRRFLAEENNSYKDLLLVIKNRYPNLRRCSVRRVKRFCSNHGIKKCQLWMEQSISHGMVHPGGKFSEKR